MEWSCTPCKCGVRQRYGAAIRERQHLLDAFVPTTCLSDTAVLEPKNGDGDVFVSKTARDWLRALGQVPPAKADSSASPHAVAWTFRLSPRPHTAHFFLYALRLLLTCRQSSNVPVTIALHTDSRPPTDIPYFVLSTATATFPLATGTLHDASRYATTKDIAAAGIRCQEPRRDSHTTSAQESTPEQSWTAVGWWHIGLLCTRLDAKWKRRLYHQERHQGGRLDYGEHSKAQDRERPACCDCHSRGPQDGSHMDSEDKEESRGLRQKARYVACQWTGCLEHSADIDIHQAT